MSQFKTIKIRRDNASSWMAVNPILADGEGGLETDTDKLKYGDGVTPWNSLPYLTQGIKGDKGDKGDTGSQGVPGHDGADGARGDKGDTGLPGSQGIQGTKGDKGDKGDKGVQGDRGLKGDTGAPGAKGDKGDKGDTGATGATGPTGATGADGLTVSVNSVTQVAGNITIDPDDLDDTLTTNKFVTSGDISKLSGIETGADVTDATNVTSAGAIMDGDITGNGLMTRTGAGAYTNRTLTGTSNQITVTNGNGVSGNPTLSLPQDIHTGASPVFANLGTSGSYLGNIYGTRHYLNSTAYLDGGTAGTVAITATGLTIGSGPGSFKYYFDAGNTPKSYIAMSDGSTFYGITGSLPAPSGTAMLGGYYSGMGIGGKATAGTNTPLFGVLASDQGGNGLGSTCFTVKADKKVYTFNSTLDDGSGNLDIAGVIKVDGTQVVTNRIIDARIDDAINSGDATTDGVIDALRDAMIAHGLIAAA